MMGNIIATVVYNTQLSEQKLSELSTNLGTLSGVLAGSRDKRTLMDNIVNTITEVLHVDAASLYMADEDNKRLVIQAASGYQKPLVETEEDVFYEWGQGVTGRIAETNEPFGANSLKDLREKGGSPQGKYDHLQGNKRPDSFYGVPLNVTGRDKPIGVLKVESLETRPFNNEDVLLIEMMGNIIATVVYNTQLSEQKLSELSTNLGTLSGVLAGSQDMQTLMNNVVNTIKEVIGVDAASLYMADEKSQRLVIQAACGYQRPLVAAKAFYEWGQGVTGRIAETNAPFWANSLDDLRRKGGSEKGKYDDLQGGKRPVSFYGVPLNVQGQDKPIGVLKVESLEARPFNNEDVLLIKMMGNVITTVIQNTRLSNTYWENLLSQAFSNSLSLQADSASLDILRSFVVQKDLTVLKASSSALLSSLPNKSYAALEEQTRTLLSLNADSTLFQIMGEQSKDARLTSWYNTLHDLSQSPDTNQKKIPDALLLEKTWQAATNAAQQASQNEFRQAVERLATTIAISCGGQSEWIAAQDEWVIFNLQHVLPISPEIRVPQNLPILFFQGARWQSQQDLDGLVATLPTLKEKGLGNIVAIISFLSQDQWEQSSNDLRRVLQAHAIDFFFLTLQDIQLLACIRNPQNLLLSRLLAEVNLLTVSPYEITGPTPDNMFFGRESELREISEHAATASYGIIGGRKVGKTSILHQLYRVRLPATGFRTIYHDSSIMPTYDAFLATAIRNWRPEPPPDAPTTFGDLLQSPPTDKPLVLLLDEADKLVPADRANEWRLFNALRALVNSGHIQVILCGERTLREALRDPSSPLFNFANEMALGLLDFPDVEKLVTGPMKQLRIELVEEATMVRRIHDFTSGHPNVVQRLCRRLIERLNEHNTRHITLDDLNAVTENPDFVREDFLGTYFSRASTLEHLCALLMATDSDLRTLASIHEALAAKGITATLNQIDAALERLVDLRNILERTSAGYDFAVTAFPLIISKSKRVPDWIALRREVFVHVGDIAPEMAPPELKGRLW
jgi:transcriptional regulator with GAF, ATPase, and Fis domain